MPSSIATFSAKKTTGGFPAAKPAEAESTLEDLITKDKEDQEPKASSRQKKSLFVADAFSNPRHVQFALKVTLAGMLGYFFYTASDYFGSERIRATRVIHIPRFGQLCTPCRLMKADTSQSRMAGGFLIQSVRGNPPLEMRKPTYRELATNLDLWCKFVLLEEEVSEREFNEMSISRSKVLMSFSSTASSFLSLSICLPSLSDSFSRLPTLCSTLRNLSSDIAGKDISFAAQCHEAEHLAAKPSKWSIEKTFLACPGVASIYASE